MRMPSYTQLMEEELQHSAGEVTTGLMPDSWKAWFKDNQPYSTIGGAGLG